MTLKRRAGFVRVEEVEVTILLFYGCTGLVVDASDNAIGGHFLTI